MRSVNVDFGTYRVCLLRPCARVTPGELVHDNKVTVMGLTEGKPYEFRVAAVNEAGPGEYAETKQPIKPAPAPSQFPFIAHFIRVSNKVHYDHCFCR